MKRREFIATSSALLGAACVPDALAIKETHERNVSQAVQDSWMKDATAKLEAELVTKYGASQRERIQRGLKQVADFWRKEDGARDVFEDFVRTNFAGDQPTLDQLFNRFQYNLEQLDGHMAEIGREFRQQSDLDTGAILPFDDLFAGYDPSAHATDDFFQNKLAFVGHNVEQTFSLNNIDYYTLHGVPNTAFTEALAFVFQAHDLELLGRKLCCMRLRKRYES